MLFPNNKFYLRRLQWLSMILPNSVLAFLEIGLGHLFQPCIVLSLIIEFSKGKYLCHRAWSLPSYILEFVGMQLLWSYRLNQAQLKALLWRFSYLSFRYGVLEKLPQVVGWPQCHMLDLSMILPTLSLVSFGRLIGCSTTYLPICPCSSFETFKDTLVDDFDKSLVWG